MKKLTLTIIIVLILALVSVNNIVPASTVQTISIVGVTEDEKVTIQTYNFPPNRDFDVLMGEFITLGVGGNKVGTVNSGSGESQKFTFDIPRQLYGQEKIAIRLESKTDGYFSFNWFYNTDYGTHEEAMTIEGEKTNPIISVTQVKKDTFASIQGSRFPTNESFDVLMGKFGTQGIGGVKVSTFTPKADGTIFETLDIPASLKSESRIAIRVESTTSDLFAHTWFLNQTGAVGGAGVTTPYTGIPTITIMSVTSGETVTVRTNNFPANRTFNVLMGQIGTRGIGGTQVTTMSSGGGGSFVETFDIPAGLKANFQISIRLQTDDGIFYAYNWFYNNTTTSQTATQPITQPSTQPSTSTGYSGIPTFSITGVVRDDTVTIRTNNFPANYDFKVLMGKMGTQGIGGSHVTTISSGSGGAFTGNYAIPESLAGDNRIAIRLESTTGGFYAFNWFYNNTYP